MGSSGTPPTEAAQQWRQLVDNSGLRQQAMLTAAGIVADDLAETTPDAPLDEQGRTEHWYRIAVLIYELLHETHALVDEADRQQCRIDATAVKTWLTSPANFGITEQFSPGSREVDHRVAGLLEAAIRAGHLAAPGYQIELLHLAARPGRIDEHLISLRRPDRTAVVSDRLRTADLLDPDLSGIDAAIAVLDRTAAIVNDLLSTQPTRPTPVAGPSADRDPAAQAFPALDLHKPSTAPAPPPATPTPPRGRRR